VNALPKNAYSILFLLTLFFGIAPLLVYHYEITHGILTNADDWYRQGHNHGPWRETSEGLLIFFPQLLLAWAVAMSAIFVEVRNARAQAVTILGLISLQFVAFALQFIVLGWTFD
jgi:hypothetical protein